MTDQNKRPSPPPDDAETTPTFNEPFSTLPTVGGADETMKFDSVDGGSESHDVSFDATMESNLVDDENASRGSFDATMEANSLDGGSKSHDVSFDATMEAGSPEADPAPSHTTKKKTLHAGTGRTRVNESKDVGPQTINIPEEFSQSQYVTAISADGPGHAVSDPGLPKSVGKYRLIRELGRGAFGVVYLGSDDDLDRRVAIKLSLVDDVDFQERLMVEASRAAKVAGDHIVPILHVDRTEFGAVYIVQKYIEGCSLSSLLRSDKEITPGQAAVLVYQLAMGLQSAHEGDVLHRDLKPDNILIQLDGTPFIVDFGLAVSESELSKGQKEFAGTPPYMSPEQITGQVGLMDGRSDIWSLGVIYYQLLTRKRPFGGRSLKEIREQVCNLIPAAISKASSQDLTEDFDQIFDLCCAKDLASRYPSVDELAEDLRELVRRHATPEDVINPLGVDHDGESDAPTEIEVSTRKLGAKQRALMSLVATEFETNLGTHSLTRVDSSMSTIVTSFQHASPRSKVLVVTTAVALLAVLGAGLTYGIQNFLSRTAGNDRAFAIPVDPDLMEYDEQEGGVRLVAMSGKAHYRTIQAAIDQAGTDQLETISVGPGIYPESLLIEKPVRLMATDLEQKPELIGDGTTLITVACDAGPVSLEGVILSGKDFYPDENGVDQPAKFNLIDVIRGELEISQCELDKNSFGRDDTYNAIKIKETGSARVRQCDFLRTPGFAISAINHSMLTVQGCRFGAHGVQVDGGPGEIHDCDFQGVRGVQVQHSGDATIQVSECRFESLQFFAMNATASGRLNCQSNQYIECEKGIFATAASAEEAAAGNFGVVEAKNEQFDNCKNAVVIINGQMEMSQQCRITGGETGILAQGGVLQATDLAVTDCQYGIHVESDAERVMLESVSISNCENEGINLVSCRRTEIRDVSVVDCMQLGVRVAQGETVIDRLTAKGGQFGLVLEGSPDVKQISNLDLSECRFGILCKPDDDSLLSFEIADSKFSNCGTAAIYAFPIANISLRKVQIEGVPEGQKPYVARDGASITVVE